MSQQDFSSQEQKFSAALKGLRMRRGLSQQVLAQELGISAGSIGNWESAREVANVSNLRKIADYFGVSIDYLRGVPNATEVETNTYSRPGALIEAAARLGQALQHAREDLAECERQFKLLHGMINQQDQQSNSAVPERSDDDIPRSTTRGGYSAGVEEARAAEAAYGANPDEESDPSSRAASPSGSRREPSRGTSRRSSSQPTSPKGVQGGSGS